MPITHKYTLLCDDIRQENNGKFIILGLYTPDIVVPAVPFALPSIGFFVVVEAQDMSGMVDFSFRLTQGDAIMSGGSGKMAIPKTGVPGVIALRLGAVQFMSANRYRFVLEIDGGGEQIVHEFSVVLAVQNAPQVPPATRLH